MTESENTPLNPSAFLARRNFIQLGLAALGAAWAGTFVQSRLFPVEQVEAEAKPVTIPVTDLPIGGSYQVTYAGVPVMVVRTPESIKAFSLICTHLGCLVSWQADKEEFYCPCHDGRFDKFGEVIAGPPPVPLEAFPVRVQDDAVILGEEF